MKIVDLAFIKTIYTKRKENTHKGNYGHALLIAGSSNKMGAALIASKACLRSGVGLLTVSIPKDEKLALLTFLPEAMIHFREAITDFSVYNVVGIGPGLEQNESAQKEVYASLLKAKALVMDADALNILAINQDWFSQLPVNTILTPHPKEFDRLFGIHHSEEERRNTAAEKAKQYNCVLVLKGHQTFITNGTDSFENTTGNSGLAKGGSGDALTGIIVSFLAQNYSPIQATILGVYLHGLAADITLNSQSNESMLITDVIENIGLAFKKIQE
ncbi:NAD(P)H-hydrate dehydratase [Flavobacterium jejuense]|uniref:ADP-dependent (S)-NAD(P)H-hydrate dehydratase n=1 Tax=Flavobacterium jejuense TaxID=1544455 RepID=A0ABX0IRV8_9FLAO|nr:NAD(P)H-hydrate dehydratase [Flavobacterium jejuense]NHN25587.1 NAD(P)H-hydrate dehydratase [Flavobacterium jejuense]